MRRGGSYLKDVSLISPKILDYHHSTSNRRTGGAPLGEDGEVKPDEGKKPPIAYLEAFKRNLELKIPIYLIFGEFADLTHAFKIQCHN